MTPWLLGVCAVYAIAHSLFERPKKFNRWVVETTFKSKNGKVEASSKALPDEGEPLFDMDGLPVELTESTTMANAMWRTKAPRRLVDDSRKVLAHPMAREPRRMPHAPFGERVYGMMLTSSTGCHKAQMLTYCGNEIYVWDTWDFGSHIMGDCVYCDWNPREERYEIMGTGFVRGDDFNEATKLFYNRK